MRFDFTKGQEAKYKVCIYREDGDDFCYFHTFKQAKVFFERQKIAEQAGTSISLWNMKDDIRKDYVRI